MHITLDNALAFSVLIIILITFMGYIIPTAYISFTTVKEHQLDEIAESMIDKILLTPGYPEDWGNITKVNYDDDLLSFGLQETGGNPYEVDVDKVLRIINVGDHQLPSTIRINYSRISELLGLGNEYGFRIKIGPALNVSIVNKETGVFKGQTVITAVDILVTTPEGRPAIGANVTALYIFMTVVNKGGGDVSDVNYTYMSSFTQWDGSVKLDFSEYVRDLETKLNGDFKKAIPSIVIYAEYYGIRATNSEVLGDESDVLKGTAVGNYLIIDYDIDEILGAAHIQDVSGLATPPYYVYLLSIVNDTNGNSGYIVNPGAKQHRVYKIMGNVDDDVAFMIVPVKQQGWPHAKIVVFQRPPFNSICQFGGAHGNIKTSVVRRIVKIGSFHYIVEVSVWRWGEG